MQPNTVAQFATELKLAPQVLLEQLRLRQRHQQRHSLHQQRGLHWRRDLLQ